MARFSTAMTPSRPISPPTAIGPDASDTDLVAGVARLDQSALAEIYRRHGGAVFGLSRRVLGDEGLAEDITQEVFVRLWNEPQRFDATRGTLRSFLQRQSHSRSIERVRSEEARRRREDRTSALDATSVAELESEVLRSIDADRVRAALDRLAPPEREAIIAAYFGGRSYREVAVALGVPEGTVKSRIRSGLSTLSTLLADPELTS
jgi:RNA polymerase sigma-70 factor (ECF subfamily)